MRKLIRQRRERRKILQLAREFPPGSDPVEVIEYCTKLVRGELPPTPRMTRQSLEAEMCANGFRRVPGARHYVWTREA
jgi:hypothetical protein